MACHETLFFLIPPGSAMAWIPGFGIFQHPGWVFSPNISERRCQLSPNIFGEDEDSQFSTWTAYFFRWVEFLKLPEVWLNHRSGQVWKGAWKGGQWFEQRSWGMAFIGDFFHAPAIFQALNSSWDIIFRVARKLSYCIYCISISISWLGFKVACVYKTYFFSHSRICFWKIATIGGSHFSPKQDDGRNGYNSFQSWLRICKAESGWILLPLEMMSQMDQMRQGANVGVAGWHGSLVDWWLMVEKIAEMYGIVSSQGLSQKICQV